MMELNRKGHKHSNILWLPAVLLLALVVGSPPLSAGDDDVVELEIKLTSKETGKPIQNASVYVKFKEQRRFRRDKKREWSSKTNPDGRALFPGVPEGMVLVQIVASGWKTYGQFHEIKSPKLLLEISLERPPKWF